MREGDVYTPVTPDVVVHDGYVIEDLGEPGNVGQGCAVWTMPGKGRGSCGEDHVLADWVFAELLQEGKEIGGIVRGHDVATNALVSRIFPAAYEIIIGEHRHVE